MNDTLRSPALPAAAAWSGARADRAVNSAARVHSALSDRLFHYTWLLVNALLILSVLFALYAVGWEFSTRRYLRGFSDAIVPATAPGDEKVEEILRWMQHGPARLPYGPSALVPDRNPPTL